EVGGVTATWKVTSDPGSGPLSAVPDLTTGNPPQAGEVVLGISTADRVGATVGDALVVEGREFTVAAIGPVREVGEAVALIGEEDAKALGSSMMPVQIFIAGTVDLDALDSVAEGSVVLSGEEQRAGEARTVGETLVGVIGALTVFVA